MRSEHRRSGEVSRPETIPGIPPLRRAVVRALSIGLGLLVASLTARADDVGGAERVLITMQARQFVPPSLVLHAGKKTTLLLDNEDVELHAFVPVGLFTGVNVSVAGNGAPEFGPHGLKKIIIPSHGRAEIHFIPAHQGVFPFFCDMPGHDMRSTIRVE